MIQNEHSHRFCFEGIVGESDSIQAAKELARRVADSDIDSILLQGETGTGKDLFARTIHSASQRDSFPYVAINCAALPSELLESELFGYEKGAFTDAKVRKQGLLELARSGTVFLDEIGELDISLQAKLLRVLEENTFRRVGGLEDLPLNARVISASNRCLRKETRAGAFRLDLYFRLSVIEIDIPPLRKRGGDDVILLANHYIREINKKNSGRKLRGLSPEVISIFKHYDWEGNVRELRNVIERAALLEDGEIITTQYLPSIMLESLKDASLGEEPLFVIPREGISLDEFEAQIIKQALDRTQGNVTRAAKLLDLSRDRMRYRLKKLL